MDALIQIAHIGLRHLPLYGPRHFCQMRLDAPLLYFEVVGLSRSQHLVATLDALVVFLHASRNLRQQAPVFVKLVGGELVRELRGLPGFI